LSAKPGNNFQRFPRIRGKSKHYYRTCRNDIGAEGEDEERIPVYPPKTQLKQNFAIPLL